jgi:hypothetical protein
MITKEMATSETLQTTNSPDHAIPGAVFNDWHALKGRMCGRKAKAASKEIRRWTKPQKRTEVRAARQ